MPNSLLWLLRFPAAAEENIVKEAAKAGVFQDQLVFTDVAPKDEHVARGFLADLFLDTTPCNGHTTTADILWSGTPVITLTLTLTLTLALTLTITLHSVERHSGNYANR